MRNIFKVFAIGVLMTGTIVLTGCGEQGSKEVERTLPIVAEATTVATETTAATTTDITTTTTTTAATIAETETTTTTTTINSAAPVIETVVITEVVKVPVTEIATTTTTMATTTTVATTAREIIAIATTTTKPAKYRPTDEEIAEAVISIANNCLNYTITDVQYCNMTNSYPFAFVVIEFDSIENPSVRMTASMEVRLTIDNENKTFSLGRITQGVCWYGGWNPYEVRDEIFAILPMAAI